MHHFYGEEVYQYVTLAAAHTGPGSARRYAGSSRAQHELAVGILEPCQRSCTSCGHALLVTHTHTPSLSLSAAIVNPEDSKDRTFTFDFSYNSFVPRDDKQYASQLTVWNDIGVGILNNAWEGMCGCQHGGHARACLWLSHCTALHCSSATGHPTGYNTSLFAYGQTGAGKVCALWRPSSRAAKQPCLRSLGPLALALPPAVILHDGLRRR